VARPRNRSRSLSQQAFDLRHRLPQGQVRLIRGQVMWTGGIQPSPLSREYTIHVVYKERRLPQVRAVDRLATRAGESLPHVFDDGSLCLHRDGEWTPDMFLVDSTLAWTSEWLFNYELWLPSGRWYGGGEWPPARPPAPVDAVAASTL
jgi:hypothetical protein